MEIFRQRGSRSRSQIHKCTKSKRSWRGTEKNEEEKCIFIVEDSLQKKIELNLTEAKQEEISTWNREDIYVEVPNSGQQRLSTTWLISKNIEKN